LFGVRRELPQNCSQGEHPSGRFLWHDEILRHAAARSRTPKLAGSIPPQS
jgi:hypothetical protein